MIRIAGIVLPNEKPIYIALTSVYGIGESGAKKICTLSKVDPQKRTKNISSEEEIKLRSIIEKNFKLEGDLRTMISVNIRRLKEIHSYRGSRHSNNLPARGQRTKTNARTKRGKKVTVGSGRKKSAEKT